MDLCEFQAGQEYIIRPYFKIDKQFLVIIKGKKFHQFITVYKQWWHYKSHLPYICVPFHSRNTQIMIKVTNTIRFWLSVFSCKFKTLINNSRFKVSWFFWDRVLYVSQASLKHTELCSSMLSRCCDIKGRYHHTRLEVAVSKGVISLIKDQVSWEEIHSSAPFWQEVEHATNSKGKMFKEKIHVWAKGGRKERLRGI